VVIEAPLAEVMKIDAMIKDFLELLTETKIDSNDVNNENNEIKEHEISGDEKQEDITRKMIINKRRNEETCEVKNENIENILMKGNETAQKVKSNLVFILGYAGEAFDAIEDF
ncbi:28266_t:CDS:2, partial [Racocetra persica]